MKLRELTAEGPSGDIVVVFPNSVVFTGTFFKVPRRARPLRETMER